MNHLLRLGLLVAALAAVCAAPASAAPSASLRMTGTILSSGSSSLELRTSDGRTVTFRLVSGTTYVQDGQPATQAALLPGRPAVVKYHQEADGSLKAKEVKVDSATGAASAPIVVRGTILALSAGTLSVKPDVSSPALSLRLDGATVLDANGRPLDVGALHTGLHVKVRYRVEPDGSLKAQKVKLLPARKVSFVLEGTLVSAGATLRIHVREARENGTATPSLAGVMVALGLAPGAVVTENRRVKRAAALAAGDRVQVSGTLANGVFTAQRVVAQRIAKQR